MLFTDVSGKRAISAFKRAGFWILKTRSTKHVGMSNGMRKITIPRANCLNPYTLKSIIRDAGLTDQEFKDLL